jgi:hypothetical protein
MIKLTNILRELREDDDFDLSDNPVVGSSEKALKRRFEREVPIVRLEIGDAYIDSRGEIFDLDNLPDPTTYAEKDLVRFYPPDYFTDIYRVPLFEAELRDFIDNVQKGEPKDITQFLGATWDKCMITKEYKIESYGLEDTQISVRLDYDFYLKGRTKDGDEIILTPNESYGFQKPFKVLSEKGEVVIKHSLKNEDYRKSILAALFPGKYEKPDELKANFNIRQILDFTRKKVGIIFGRVKRGGPGIIGKYDDLKKYLTTTSQKRLQDYSDGFRNGGLFDDPDSGEYLEIKWDDMIIYREEGDTLFAVLGKDQFGRKWMCDRAGHGSGSYTKLRGPLKDNQEGKAWSQGD